MVAIIESVLAPQEEPASVSYQDAFSGALTVIRSCIPEQALCARRYGEKYR